MNFQMIGRILVWTFCPPFPFKMRTSGDVKYHLGTQFDRSYPDGRKLHLELLANPSHLEAVNPLVLGKTKAKMYFEGDESGKQSLPMLIHGDAAIAGQGIVYESMQLCGLEGFHTGGTIHVVCNNQVKIA